MAVIRQFPPFSLAVKVGPFLPLRKTSQPVKSQDVALTPSCPGSLWHVDNHKSTVIA